jgi:glycosyltransferase involved in cell wall biosynthesis
VTRPLTVALIGAADSPASRLLDEAAAGGRVERVSGTGGDADLVLVDDSAPSARATRRWLRARGVRALPVSRATTTVAGRAVLDVGAMAAAAARPGAGLDGGDDLSVIVTVLNESAVIDDLVETLTGQMRTGDELLIVDGGSTDGTWERLKSWGGRDSRVIVHSLPDSNISAGRNHAVAHARNQLMACTDAGCQPGPGWLDGLRAGFAERPAPALVASVPRIAARTPLEFAQAAACHPDPDDLRRPSLLVRAYGRLFGTVFDPTLPFARSLAFTRTAWQRAGGFPENLGTTEDGVFGRAVSKHGTCLATLDAEVVWRQRSSLRATYRMYRRYGEGAAQSGDATLRTRDAVRALAYPGALLLLLRAPRRSAPLLLGGGALYLSLPMRRLARRSALVPAGALVPVALVTKDVAKVHGAVGGALVGRRRRRRAGAGGGRLRIQVVLPSFEAGGAERHALTMYPALDRDRFEVRITCIKGEGALYAEAHASGLEVTALNAGESNLAILGTFARLAAEMRAFAPDVVATSGFSADVVGRLAAAVTGVPAIVTWKHNCGHVGRFGPRERAAEMVLRHLTTRYLAVATAQLDYLTGYLGLPASRISVIHNSVRAPQSTPSADALARLRRSVGIGELDAVLGVVGALRAWKGHATLLRAFALILDAESRARLLVVGDGEESDSLRILASSLGIDDRVHFLGDRRDVADLLCIIDVVALPSHNIECFPFAILEAMSRARPAVATAIGGLPELIDAGVSGLLVAPGDHRALAAALLTILQTPDRGASFGRAGYRRLVECFPFDATVQRIEDEMVTAVAAARAERGGRRDP